MSVTDQPPFPTAPMAPVPERPDRRWNRTRWVPYAALIIIGLGLTLVAALVAGLLAGGDVVQSDETGAAIDAGDDGAALPDAGTATTESDTTDGGPAGSTPEDAGTNTTAATTNTTAAAPASTAVTSAAPGTTSCSAAGFTPATDQTGLPPAVAAKRAAIIDAATRCDISGLAALTSETFSASFGGGDAATLWAEAEARGETPLLILVQLLDQEPGIMQSEGGDFYLWPTAFLHDRWDEVTPGERAALAAIYSEDELKIFEETGAYVGYRIAIHESGDWSYYLAGD